MKRYKVIEASNPFLYHVTDTKNISKIKKQGLLMAQTSNWVKADGERYGNGEVYAFEHPNDAVRWAARMGWDSYKNDAEGKISIVKFKKKGKWVVDKNDPLSQAGSKGRWLKTLGKVEPTDIVKIIPVGLELTRKLVADEDLSGVI